MTTARKEREVEKKTRTNSNTGHEGNDPTVTTVEPGPDSETKGTTTITGNEDNNEEVRT